MKSKRQILKEAMSVKYCGQTRFDFLDDEERPLIYKAMERYATQVLLKHIENSRKYPKPF